MSTCLLIGKILPQRHNNDVRTTHLGVTIVSLLLPCTQPAFTCLNSNYFIVTLYPAGIKVNHVIIRTMCKIRSKLTIKTPKQGSGVSIVKFEHISPIVVVFPLLTLNK